MATRAHPSDRLYNGEVNDSLEAMQVVEAVCEIELHHVLAYPDEQDRERGAAFRDYKTAASTAGAIYREHMERAKAAAVQAMRDSDDDLEMFADALERGDYRDLAI